MTRPLSTAVSPAIAFAAVLGSMVLIVFANALIGGDGAGLTLGQLAAIQLTCIALPALAVARYLAPHGISAAIAWHRPHPRAIAGAAVIGATLWIAVWIVVVPLSVQIFGSREAHRLAASLLSDDAPLGWELFAIALVPAVAEEILFRGVLTRALAARHGMATAVILSAAVFALYHLSPARLLSTFALGAVLAVVALRSGSIVPGMIVHALGNAAAVIFGRLSETSPAVRAISDHGLASASIAVVLCVIGIWLIVPQLAHSGCEPSTSQ